MSFNATRLAATLAAALVALTLALPAAAQPVIPATEGPDACTQGGSSQINAVDTGVLDITDKTVTISTPGINLADVRMLAGTTKQSYSLSMSIRENGVGSSGSILTSQSLGIVTTEPSSRISANQRPFTGLKKNTRYVFIIYEQAMDNPLIRRCFKTRGEFSNAELNLRFYDPDNDGVSEWLPNPAYNQTGCYAVARTTQDIRDCYCNGTRNGTHILAGQTVASQEQRRYLNCPDLDN